MVNIVYLPAHEIRRLFNESTLPAMIQDGRLRQRMVKSNHPSRTKANEPFCTRSELVAYHDRMGVKFVQAHRYLRTDGSIGASGREDPKQILLNGTLYSVLP